MKKTEPRDKSLSLFIALKLEQRENRRLRKALQKIKRIAHDESATLLDCWIAADDGLERRDRR